MSKYPKNKKAKNPGGDDVTFIYESGGRDPEHPFSDETFKNLEEETEGESGSFQIDLRNTSRNEKGGYPAAEEDEWGYQKDEQVYPSYYSKKGAPRGTGYPIEKNWWQKALSFTRAVESKYNIVIKNRLSL
jgi:hypothetical protein